VGDLTVRSLSDRACAERENSSRDGSERETHVDGLVEGGSQAEVLTS
jgi:hypothetical protein